MSADLLPLLTIGMFAIAFLYSSVGHAGASGYIAVLSLFGVAAAIVKPTALVLNVLVASIGTWQFYRAGHFSWRLFWPFALLAVPCAFLGGYVDLPARAFMFMVGCVLIFSALRFLVRPSEEHEPRPPSRAAALGAGAGLGLLAGLTGTGGGIFLTPLLILMGWATTRTAAAVSVVFILLNSVSGLLGNVIATGSVPGIALPLIGAVLAGGAAGSHLGSHRLPHQVIKRLLAVVLLIAGVKLLFTV